VFGDALFGAVGAVLFAEVEGDFVGVCLGIALFFGLGAEFFGLFTIGSRPGELLAFGAVGEGLIAEAGKILGGLLADFGTGGEVGEALEGEELVRGVVVFGDEEPGGGHDGVVDFFGGAVLAARATAADGEGIELGEGEFLAGGDLGVDEVEPILFVVQAHEGTVGGEMEVESAFGTCFADAFAYSVVGLALDVKVG
jgi:hypothetical protein